MSRRTQPQWSVARIIEAPLEQVWRAALENDPNLSAADKAELTRLTGSDPFTTSIGKPGGGRIRIEVDKRQHAVTTQGEWWYRGTVSFESHERGCLVTYRVYNIAPGVGWWAAQLVQGRQNAHQMTNQLQGILTPIARELSCKFYPVTEQ